MPKADQQGVPQSPLSYRGGGRGGGGGGDIKRPDTKSRTPGRLLCALYCTCSRLLLARDQHVTQGRKIRCYRCSRPQSSSVTADGRVPEHGCFRVPRALVQQVQRRLSLPSQTIIRRRSRAVGKLPYAVSCLPVCSSASLFVCLSCLIGLIPAVLAFLLTVDFDSGVCADQPVAK